MRIAIDTGGTFTDCVYLKDGAPAVLKVLSTPDDPSRSVLEAVREIRSRAGAALRPASSDAQGERFRKGKFAACDRGGGPKHRPCTRLDDVEIRHGTTIGTNALLERKGARVAFITTAGFEDTIAIGRQARQDLYNWMATPKPCLVPAELRFGVRERVSAEGEVLLSPDEEEIAQLCEKVRHSGAESVAISLLFSFANPENEKRLAAALEAKVALNVRTDSYTLQLPASLSHAILPEFREYERAATVVVNAYLAPKAGGYMRRLESSIRQEHDGSLYVMQSSGGIVSARLASEEPVRTVLSGPAGGVIGAHRIAQIAGFNNIIGFDMGGTSTDVSLIEASGPKITNEARVSGIPISVPMLDIHTVGAGGGSLAWFDRGGILHVGPQSAGADPGPICYGRGEQPTVTDANFVLGRLDAGLTLAGTVALDRKRTREFMDKSRGPIPSVEEFAAGIVRLAEAEMEKAIRLISVERGHDPRAFTLACFGGAGPLHACALARALGIPRVLVPAMPGALSALGILMSDVVRDYSRTVMIPVTAFLPSNRAQNAGSSTSAVQRTSRPSVSNESGTRSIIALLEPHFAELEARASAEFRNEGLSGIAVRSADLRYAGQGYELNVPAGPGMLQDFHAAHRKRYGHADESKPVEIVNVRVRMIASEEKLDFPSRERAGAGCSRAILKKKPVMFDGEWLETPVMDRERLAPGNCFAGPAIVHEYTATTAVLPGCWAEVDEYLNIVISV